MTTRIAIVNQASNYLTIGIANAFAREFDSVALVTGSVHVQGEELRSDVKLSRINRWYERPRTRKLGSYVLALLRIWLLLLTRYRKYDVLFVSIPPMSYLLNLILPNRSSVLVWDLYPDVFTITGMRETHWAYRLFGSLNRASFRKAYRLFTISETLADALSRYVERTRIKVLPIWSIFDRDERIRASENPFVAKHSLTGKFVVQYSGNIGITHNVETLVDVAACLKDEQHIVFQIIGRGPRRPVVEQLVLDKKLRNLQMLPFQSDEDFPSSLSAADLGVVILHERVSRGSVPSKAYNLMSFGIPSLYIAHESSELARYVEKYDHGVCFPPSSTAKIAKWILDLSQNRTLLFELQQNAKRAAADFRPDNARRYVDAYLSSATNKS